MSFLPLACDQQAGVCHRARDLLAEVNAEVDRHPLQSFTPPPAPGREGDDLRGGSCWSCVAGWGILVLLLETQSVTALGKIATLLARSG